MISGLVYPLAARIRIEYTCTHDTVSDKRLVGLLAVAQGYYLLQGRGCHISLRGVLRFEQLASLAECRVGRRLDRRR
jgi:hypothetical protein